jgi:hypothetical protein
LDNKDERSNEAVSLEMSARPKPLRPLQYWMSSENYLQLLHTKIYVKGVDAKGQVRTIHCWHIDAKALPYTKVLLTKTIQTRRFVGHFCFYRPYSKTQKFCWSH